MKPKKKLDRLTKRWDRKASRGVEIGGEMMSNKDKRRYERSERKIKKAEGTKREEKVRGRYGYNYKAADAEGITPDETGHMPSRNEVTGEILKGRKHPTIYKTKKVERALGYRIKRRDGKMYSIEKKSRKK